MTRSSRVRNRVHPGPRVAAPDPRQRDAGITLIEMLVALAIFALVGVALFTTLDTIIRVRDRTDGRLERITGIDRALLLVARDLERGRPGSTTATGDGTLGIERDGTLLGWRHDGDSLVRTVRNGAAAEPFDQRLGDGIAGAAWQVLDADGILHDVWPEPDAPTATALAVSIRLDLGDGGTARRLVELPAIP